ncbi:MAG: 4'-phosphopantetheinyl transferase superfamily protein [Chloroflexota bacterium]
MLMPNWRNSELAGSLDGNSFHLWRINLNPAGYTDLVSRSDFFASDELERAKRFRFDKHRRQYLVGRKALRQILGFYLALEPQKVKFVYGEFGKPLVEQAGVSFNLSNSHEMALIGVSPFESIGVDLEYKDRHIWDADALAKTVFTDLEQEELSQYPKANRLIPFLSGWTRKEAYLKGIGKGLAMPLKDFSVSLDNDEPNPLISAPDWRLMSFWVSDAYLAAAAYPKGEDSPEFKWFDWDQAYFDRI